MATKATDTETREVRAVAKYVRVSPSKARLVVDLIRRKSVAQAFEILHFCERAVAVDVEKVLRSAVANAEHNNGMRAERPRGRRGLCRRGPDAQAHPSARQGLRVAHPEAHEPHHRRRRSSKGGVKRHGSESLPHRLPSGHHGELALPLVRREGLREDARQRP